MEQNPYQKQFPDLMAGKRILYVHGFGSSARSGSVGRMRTMLPQAEVVAFDLPIDPHEAIALLHRKCDELRPDLIIGSSMGGMYAEQLHGYDRILINPAFEIADTMREHNLMGKQEFFSPREDGVQEFYVDKPLVKAYREVSGQCFALRREGVEELRREGVEELRREGDEELRREGEEDSRVWGLFGDRDPLVHTFDLFRQHYSQAIPFHGEHQMNDHTFLHSVVPVIRWIDDQQERRQRPIVFISLQAAVNQGVKEVKEVKGVKDNTPFSENPASAKACVFNSFNSLNSLNSLSPAPSLLKAVEMLIEHYQVYFFAPSPTNEPQFAPETVAWLQQHVGVPAHDHVVFTNQPHLLYGDYFIMRREAENDFMGAVIELGSDEFKTWDDIITYFGRLGGQ